MLSEVREFDLNIERVLEHWTVAHALREVIANALDEQALTGTAEPTIVKDAAGAWHIKDAGRGLHYKHLTQNENKEKLAHANRVIGKFGVGLKDAFATFDRHHIEVDIRSPHGDIAIAKAPKHGFTDVPTLHALIRPPSAPAMVGTEVILRGVNDAAMLEAKDFFLRYSGDALLEETSSGAILHHSGKGRQARIYVHGLHVATEPNFLFSYNITALSAPLRRALNRERSNVGRGAYSERVQAILKTCSSTAVADALVNDLKNLDRGGAHDELTWQDVALHACQILNANERVIFVTSENLMSSAALIARAQNDGYRIVVVPHALSSKLPLLKDTRGDPVRNLEEYRREWNESFEFKIVTAEQLTPAEHRVYALTEPIMELAGKKHMRVKAVIISETMRLDPYTDNEAIGVWEEQVGRIVIKRDQLRSVASYAGTLLHELTHAVTGADDVTEEFEQGLTAALGRLAAAALKV